MTLRKRNPPVPPLPYELTIALPPSSRPRTTPPVVHQRPSVPVVHRTLATSPPLPLP